MSPYQAVACTVLFSGIGHESDVGLMPRAGVEIAIDIDTAHRAFNRIDLSVLITVQLLKMIMSQIESLGIGDAGRHGTRAGIIPL